MPFLVLVLSLGRQILPPELVLAPVDAAGLHLVVLEQGEAVQRNVFHGSRVAEVGPRRPRLRLGLERAERLTTPT